MKVLIFLILILNQKVLTLEKEAPINDLLQDEADVEHPDTQDSESDQLINISNNHVAEKIQIIDKIRKDSKEESIKYLDKKSYESKQNLETTRNLDENKDKCSDGNYRLFS